MSITTPDDRITEYMPTVPTTEFAALFPIVNVDDIAVEIDGVPRSDFTVSASFFDGISNDAKAVFTPGVTGDVRVIGSRAPRRENRFGLGPLPTRDLNKAFDSVEIEIQEASRDIERSLRVPMGSEGYRVQAGIRDGRVLVMRDGVVSEGESYDGIADALEEAQAAAVGADASADRSEAARDQSMIYADLSADSAVASAASQAQAQILVNAAQAGYVGFQPGTLYDLGRVTDILEIFPGDLGRVSDL